MGTGRIKSIKNPLPYIGDKNLFGKLRFIQFFTSYTLILVQILDNNQNKFLLAVNLYIEG